VEGTIHEYEIDTQAIHTSSPDGLTIMYIAANAEGLDKVGRRNSCRRKGPPLSGPAFGLMTEPSAYRDD
jgi:hypothetical protein